MKVNTKILLAATIAAGIVYAACRKVDRVVTPPPTNNSVEERFFTSHRSNDATEKALVSYLQRVNNQKHFVEQTVKQIGYPRWDKMLASKKKDNTKAGRNSSVDSTYIYNIPFVRENENYVNASLNLKITGADTTFGYSCDWQYQQLQNTPNSVTDSAENFAVFFMTLDKSVFEHTKFKIVDSNLFRNGSHRSYYVTLSEAAKLNGRNSVFIEIEVCQEGTIYWFEECPYKDSPKCEYGCDHCILCLTPHPYTYCWDDYADDGTGGGGGGIGAGGVGGGDGGSGSGGGSGGGTPPNCTPGQNPPCEPGWIPEEEEPDASNNYCKVIDSLLANPVFVQNLNRLRDSTNRNYEIGTSFINPHSPSRYSQTNYSGDGDNATLSVQIFLSAPCDGVMHDHYNDPAMLPIFSAEDIYKLATFYSLNQIKNPKTFTFTLVTNTTSYIIMISDPVAFNAFITKWFDSAIHIKAFSIHLYQNYHYGDPGLSVAENERNFLNALNAPFINGAGIKLFRGNADMTKFSPIKANGAGQVRPGTCK